MQWCTLLILLMILLGVPAGAQDVPENAPEEEPVVYQDKDFTDQVSLQALNKITARVSTLTLSLDQKATFGNLEIALLKCWKSPPEEQPEHKALLEIWEQVPGEKKKEIFKGWMFASSPALSALEHPVYDITLLRCQMSKLPVPAAPEQSPGEEVGPAEAPAPDPQT